MTTPRRAAAGILAAALVAGAAIPCARAAQAAAPAAPAQVLEPSARRPLPVTTLQPERVRRALQLVESQRDETVAAWIEIARVPALTGQEGPRAQLVARLFASAGLTARVLPDGNVEARWPGREAGPPGVIAAHLDTVHAPRHAAEIRLTGDTLEGPGVLDDSSGLASLVGAVRALRGSGWTPRREIRFVATVSEEVGLAGARSYLEREPKLAAFVSVDGILGRVEHGATGIRWTRWTFRGRGGHTLLVHQVPSPTVAAGRAIAAISDIAETSSATINIGQIDGGSAPNAIPVEASFTADVRSDDPAEHARLVAACREAVQSAAAREGVILIEETLQDLPGATLPGHDTSPLVLGAASILEFLRVAPIVSPRGSSDHNIALLRGIPGMAVGATTGRGAHAPSESADISPLVAGTQQVVLLAVLLSEGLGETPTLGQ